MCIPRLLFAREMRAICINLAVDILTPAKAQRPKYGEGTVIQLGYVPSWCLLEERMRTSKLVVLLIVTLTALLFIIRSADAQTVINETFKEYSRSLTDVPEILTNRGEFYVPAFSSLRMGARRTRVDLAVTLSIHNASEVEPLVINRIDYFDTFGTLIQRYVTQPVALRPFGTVEVFIAADDIRGGTGANFLVGWAARGPIAEPVIETVMAAYIGTGGVAFATHGRPIRVSQENTSANGPR